MAELTYEERIARNQANLKSRGLTEKLISIIGGKDDGVVDGKDGNKYRRFAYRAFDLTKPDEKPLWYNELIRVSDKTTDVIAERAQLLADLKSKTIKSAWYSVNVKPFANGFNVQGMFSRRDAQAKRAEANA